MVTNYNDILRKQISDVLNNNSDEDIINSIEFFCNLDQGMKIQVLKLSLSDYYKLSYYNTQQEPELFRFPINQIIETCMEDMTFTISLMQAAKAFYKMDCVSKCLLLEFMEEDNQDYYINNIYKLSTLDKFTYQVVDDMEAYKKYYKEYLDTNKDNPNRIRIITEFISYRMLGIKNYDLDKYKKYVMECVNVYYRWKHFIRDHDEHEILNREDFINLEKIKHYSIDGIFNEIENSFDFLITIVGEYLYYKTQKIEIKEEIIDKYFEQTEKEEIKQKLKIK